MSEKERQQKKASARAERSAFQPGRVKMLSCLFGRICCLHDHKHYNPLIANIEDQKQQQQQNWTEVVKQNGSNSFIQIKNPKL